MILKNCLNCLTFTLPKLFNISYFNIYYLVLPAKMNHLEYNI